MSGNRRHAVPVRPTAAATSALRPVEGVVELVGGVWGDWRADNTTRTIPLAISWMRRAGYLRNLALAAGTATGSYDGMHWKDSDLYKVLEAIGWDGDRPGAEENLAFLDEATTLLERAQAADGYLNSYYQTAGLGRHWTDFAFGHEMYLAGHLVQAAVAVHRSLGDDRLLRVARRFADHLVDRFGRAEDVRVDGHPQVEMALVELFRETGEQAYLDLAALFVDARGHRTLGPGEFGLQYCQDGAPLREVDGLSGHAVRAVYLAAGATDVAVERGDSELLEHLQALWDDLVRTRSFLTGGIGSHHFHEALGARWELPPDRAYAETCASIGKMMWAHRLHLATGDPRYPHEIERVLHNGFAASTSADREHFWYRNPLYQREVAAAPPEDELLHERLEIGTRASWFDTACCPPNIMRTIASLDAYVVAARGDDVVLSQVVPVGVDVIVGGRRVRLQVFTDVPAGRRTRVTVDRDVADGGADVLVRRPRWVDGGSSSSVPDEHMSLSGPGTHDLDLPSTPTFVRPSRRVEAVAGQVALRLGPVVYALEGVDLGSPDDVHDACFDPTGVVETVPAAGTWGGMPALRVRGLLRRGDPDDPWEGDAERAVDEPATFLLRPYAGWANRGPTTMRVWAPVAPHPPDAAPSS